MKVVIYARVSTDEQVKKYSIPAQLDRQPVTEEVRKTQASSVQDVGKIKAPLSRDFYQASSRIERFLSTTGL